MKRVILARFEVDEDPYVDNLPEHQRSYAKYQAEMRAKKTLELVIEEALEYSIS